MNQHQIIYFSYKYIWGLRAKQFIWQEFIPKKASNIPLWPLSEMHNIDKSEEIIVSSNGKKEQVYTNKFFSFVNVVVESFDATIIFCHK